MERRCITLNDSQFRYIPNCSIAEPIFARTMLFEKHYKFDLPEVAAFLDLEKAYDGTTKRQIWRLEIDSCRSILIKNTSNCLGVTKRRPMLSIQQIRINSSVFFNHLSYESVCKRIEQRMDSKK